MPFAVVLAAGFMTLLDVSIVNVALPSIEANLGASPHEIQWIIAGYALTFGLTLVAAGRGGDIFGRRLFFLVGLSGFVLASAGCGFATDATMLALARLLQGMFAGILNPQVLGIMQDLFKGPARARAFGVFGIVVGISTAIGPALGGVLIGLAPPDIGWRLVFLINLPIGAVVLPLAAKYLPRSRGIRDRRGSLWGQFDLVGVILVGLTVVLVMWPFLSSSGEGGSTNGAGGAPYWLLGVAGVMMVVTYGWERWWYTRGNEVLLDPVLTRNSAFVLGTLTSFFYFAGFTSIFITITLYLQQGMGWTPLQAGVAVIPFALISGAASGVSGRLVNRFGRLVPITGALIVTVAMVIMAACALWVPLPAQPYAVLTAMATAGIGSGLIISPNQALTLNEVPGKSAGIAAALLQTFQRLGTAIGLAVVTTVYFRTLATYGGYDKSGMALAMAALIIAALTLLAFASSVADAFRRRRLTVRTDTGGEAKMERGKDSAKRTQETERE